jgi:subtilisin-like proprotein convertase family protein
MQFTSFLRYIVVVVVFAHSAVIGQKSQSIPFPIKEVDFSSIAGLGVPQINASSFRVYEMDITQLITQLEGVRSTNNNSGFIGRIEVPHPNGQIHSYDVLKNTTMSEGLEAKFPEIRTFDGYSSSTGAKMKWDVTPHGFHAMIMNDEESTIFIDPIFKGNTTYYMVYYRANFSTNKIKECFFENLDKTPSNSTENYTTKSFLNCQLRTYRLALAATVEYSNFHGGTKALAQAAQVTTMNRVNGIFERDLTLTMTIIPNNDLIVYVGATNSDPYSNGNPNNMINENQTTCDNVIGSANYDIGHVFGTNSGGLAGLGVICVGGQKARGVTGSGAPIGDPFDVDYVAHEMGHQYGANHTQNNNCNRNNATAMEPGSASTILGYAGICTPNVQNNSDDHFHGISLQEMANRINQTSCAAVASIPNTAPEILATNGNVSVPAGTPFALTAEVFDADGDVLSYCWEQMDNQITTQPPVSTSTGGPNFRSISPSPSPTRYFPNLNSLATNGPYTWEVVPTVSRTMNFRVTVRDKPLVVAGCNDYADVTVSTVASAGPFVVLYPSATGIVWNAGTTETVTWDVANTDLTPISCANVNIYLSSNGGGSYPILLASNVPNTGSAPVQVPNIGTTTARVMVISSAGTFFDVSNNNFQIIELAYDYSLTATQTTVQVCQPDQAIFPIEIGSFDGYNDPVTLSVAGVPAGTNASFSVNPVIPAGTSDLIISGTDLAVPGTYTLTVQANSTTGTKTQQVILQISSNTPGNVSLLAPANGQTVVQIPTLFTWSTGEGSGIQYEIQVATEPSFTAIVDQANGLTSASFTSNSLAQGTVYYWRVRYANTCATTEWSNVFTFTTKDCTTYSSTNVPVTIPTVGTVTSTITIPAGGNITDVNVPVLQGTHNRVGHLTFSLTSPQGTTVVLMNQVCGNVANFNLGFDDQAASATIPCPPTTGNIFQPVGNLSAFNGQNPQGVWTLTITDNTNPIGGSLSAWSLEICNEVTVIECSNPTVPVISGGTTICDGNAQQLSVSSGDLNDANDWYWYEGSCGGTPIGVGNQVTVTPNTTSTYFVRGEGNCVIPGACGEITVNVNPVYATTEEVTICTGNSYVFGSQVLTDSGTYTEVFSSLDGCDSTVVLTLNVVSGFSSTDELTICSGNSYEFGTQTLTNSGIYTEVFTSIGGCDSTVVLTLTIVPVYNETEEATICSGSSYVFGTQVLTNPGSYTELFTSTEGCDSTVVLTLHVLPTFSTTDQVSICEGDTYIFGGQSLTSDGSYTEVFQSADGCDSTVVLTLTVLPIYTITQNVSICAGDSYTFPDGTVGTIAQSNTSSLTSTDGCDSTVVTNLSVVNFDLTVTQSGNTLNANQTGATYQWIDCATENPVDGAISASFTPQNSGAYAVIISSGNCADTSVCTTVNLANLTDFDVNQLQVYPNPTSGELFIKWTGTLDKIELHDALGRIIYTSQETLNESTQLQLAHVASGVYFLRLYHQDGIHVSEIVKQ